MAGFVIRIARHLDSQPCVLPPTGGQGRFTPVVQFLLPNSPDMRTVPEGGNGPMTVGLLAFCNLTPSFAGDYCKGSRGRPLASLIHTPPKLG